MAPSKAEARGLTVLDATFAPPSKRILYSLPNIVTNLTLAKCDLNGISFAGRCLPGLVISDCSWGSSPPDFSGSILWGAQIQCLGQTAANAPDFRNADLTGAVIDLADMPYLDRDAFAGAAIAGLRTTGDVLGPVNSLLFALGQSAATLGPDVPVVRGRERALETPFVRRLRKVFGEQLTFDRRAIQPNEDKPKSLRTPGVAGGWQNAVARAMVPEDLDYTKETDGPTFIALLLHRIVAMLYLDPGFVPGYLTDLGCAEDLGCLILNGQGQAPSGLSGESSRGTIMLDVLLDLTLADALRVMLDGPMHWTHQAYVAQVIEGLRQPLGTVRGFDIGLARSVAPCVRHWRGRLLGEDVTLPSHPSATLPSHLSHLSPVLSASRRVIGDIRSNDRVKTGLLYGGVLRGMVAEARSAAAAHTPSGPSGSGAVSSRSTYPRVTLTGLHVAAVGGPVDVRGVTFEDCVFDGVDMGQWWMNGTVFRGCTFDKAFVRRLSVRQREVWGTVIDAIGADAHYPSGSTAVYSARNRLPAWGIEKPRFVDCDMRGMKIALDESVFATLCVVSGGQPPGTIAYRKK